MKAYAIKSFLMLFQGDVARLSLFDARLLIIQVPLLRSLVGAIDSECLRRLSNRPNIHYSLGGRPRLVAPTFR